MSFAVFLSLWRSVMSSSSIVLVFPSLLFLFTASVHPAKQLLSKDLRLTMFTTKPSPNPRTAPIKHRTTEDLQASYHDLIPCGEIPQGMGGIYTFPIQLPSQPGDQTVQTTTVIGTTGCTTCEGVYIPIDAHRCFAAHFDAAMFKYHTSYADITERNGQLITSLRLAVQTSLEKTFPGMESELTTIRNSEHLKARAAVVSTWQIICGHPGPGWHILDVVCSFFHLDKLALTNKCGGHHGFIVDHADDSAQSLHLLAWDRPAPTERVFDEIAKLAERGEKRAEREFVGVGEKLKRREYIDLFGAVYGTTYRMVRPSAAGWWARSLEGYGGKELFTFRDLEGGGK
jgi:hypothetical protein